MRIKSLLEIRMSPLSQPTFWLLGPLVALAFSVSGCFGIIWVGDEKSELVESSVIKDKIQLEELERGFMLWKPSIEMDGSGREIRTYQKDARWGEPFFSSSYLYRYSFRLDMSNIGW